MDKKVSRLLELYEQLCAGGIQSDKNLFEMAPLKEFRHSAILGYLLGRKERGENRNLNALLERILPVGVRFTTEKVSVTCERPVSYEGRTRPIDIFCEFDGKALIIENKCRGAVDQERQLADYWNGVKGLGYADRDIFVLYLPPMNDFQMPTVSSLDGLDLGSESKDHLIVRSYRKLILPWLKDDVLPNTVYGAGVLVNSLQTYIDLLEGAYGERPDDKYEYVKRLEWMAKSLPSGERDALRLDTPDGQWMWVTSTLNEIEEALANDKKRRSEDRSEEETRKLVELQSFLWNVRVYLREKDPLLDPDNLIYQVYWMLRNSPTAFGAKCMERKIDTGMFFRSGRKGSIWDMWSYKDPQETEHAVEVVCDSKNLIDYLTKGTAETVLTFGVGNLEADSPFAKRLQTDKRWMLLRLDSGWTTISVPNDVLASARQATGGTLLWAVAEAIAQQARAFSDLIE